MRRRAIGRRRRAIESREERGSNERKPYESAHGHAGCYAGHGAGAHVAGYPTAGGEEAEEEGDVVERLYRSVSH